MARALVTKLRIPDTAAQTRKSPVARSGRAEASCRDISNTWLAHGYSSSSLTTPATQSGLRARGYDWRSESHTNKSYAITMSLLRIGVLAAQIAVSPSAAAQWRNFLASSLSISRQETER